MDQLTAIHGAFNYLFNTPNFGAQSEVRRHSQTNKNLRHLKNPNKELMGSFACRPEKSFFKPNPLAIAKKLYETYW